MVVWVGSDVWVGSYLWNQEHSPADRYFYLGSALVGDGTSGAVLTVEPVATAALLSDGTSLAVLTQQQSLTATLTFG